MSFWDIHRDGFGLQEAFDVALVNAQEMLRQPDVELEAQSIVLRQLLGAVGFQQQRFWSKVYAVMC